MKLKFIAAALIAVMCIIPLAGCGCESKEEASSKPESSQAATPEQAANHTYEISGVSFASKVDVNDYIKGAAVDMDKLAADEGYQKTDKAATWTIANNGARFTVALTDLVKEVYTGVSSYAATMDGKRETVTTRYALTDKDKMYTYNEAKIPFKGILLAVYTFENAPTSTSKDPFNGKFDQYKNDKGDYYLPPEDKPAPTSATKPAATKAAGSDKSEAPEKPEASEKSEASEKPESTEKHE